jgi:hypothetical protein
MNLRYPAACFFASLFSLTCWLGPAQAVETGVWPGGEPAYSDADLGSDHREVTTVGAEMVAARQSGSCRGGAFCIDGCPGCSAFLKGLPSDCLDKVPAEPDLVRPPDEEATPSIPSDLGEATPPSDLDMPLSSDFGDSPPPSSLSQALGATAEAAGVPDMIGDFFGGGFNLVTVVLNGPPNATPHSGPTVPVAGGDRRTKIAEVNNPFPRDRFLFTYNYFNNPLIDINENARDLSRYMFGFERTIFNRRQSVEVRLPFAGALNSTQVGYSPDTTATEFGNVSLTYKRLLFNNGRLAAAAGTTVVFPTGDSATIINNGANLPFNTATFENEAVHTQPFLGLACTPTSRIFNLFFVAVDIDAGGNEVIIDNVRSIVDDQTLLFLDYTFGFWAYRNPRAALIRGIAPMVELHYTSTLQDIDPGPVPVPVNVGVPRSGIFVDNRRDLLNMTGGIHARIGRSSTLRFAAALPMRGNTDRFFDAEFMLQYVRNL